MYRQPGRRWLPLLLLASLGAVAAPPVAAVDGQGDGTLIPAAADGAPAGEAAGQDPGTGATSPADLSLLSDGPDVPAPDTNVPVEPAAQDEWLDKLHDGIYRGVNATGDWVDGLFAGDTPPPAENQEPFGRVGIGTFWDQRDSFDPSFRLRTRIPLPHLRNRVGVFFGRAPEREAVENRPRAGSDSLPNRFNDVDDNAWLLGLGYAKDSQLSRGLQLDAGVRIRADPEVIARGIYRWNLEVSERTLFRPSQTVFWRRTEGFGTTTNLVLDHLLNNRFLVRTAIAGTVSEEADGVEWQSYATLYQDLSGKDTLGYSVVAAGETQADVELQNYGFQLRYRRQILREWLFMEVLQSVTWPREFLAESRETNYGVGIGFEMYFGAVPAEQLR